MTEEQRQVMTGAQAIVNTLEALGVTDVFGMPGGAILPTFDPLMSSSLHHILVRHEQGAGHAAQGYALASGKVGVAIVTSGPGATNTLTAIADANIDSVPVVVISGQVGASLIGTDAFQEADIVGASMPLAKHSFLVTRAAEIPQRLAEAFHIASTGRPGPVLVDITRSAQVEEFEYHWPVELQLPGYEPAFEPVPRQIARAAEEIARAQAPVLYVGGGLVRARAEEELRTLVELSDAPVVTTLPARGAFPDSDPHNLKMPGMHGTVPAVGALQRADLIVALGARFDDRVTGQLDSFAPRARIVHVDIDLAEMSKNRYADVAVVADLKPALAALNAALPEAYERLGRPDLSGWWRYLNRLREKYPLGWSEPSDGFMAPQEVISKLSEIAGPDAIYVTGVGQHQMWASQFIDFENQHAWISSGGLGTMGYGLPAAIGASVGSAREFEGKKPVWLIDGDGSFQMTSEELAAAFLDHAPVKIAILNNSVYGMVRQWQTLFYEHHYSQTNLLDGEAHGADGAAALADGDAPLEVPDFIKLAEAYGCVGIRAFTEEEAIAAIEKANQINDRPVLIDFRVWKDAMVWPMVAAGAPNDEVTYKPGIKPLAGGTPAPGTSPDEHATGVFEHETAAATASEH